MDMVKTNVNNWIKIISIILGVLFFTLLEIALNDIENKIFITKSYDELLNEIQTKEEKDEIINIDDKIKSIQSKLDEYKYQIESLENDITSKKQTLDQLLENQKVNPNNETKTQITIYQKQFLDLQNKKDIIKRSEIDEGFLLSNLKRERDTLKINIENKYKEKLKLLEYKNERSTQIKVLAFQALLILVLFIIGTLLMIKFRKSDFFLPILAFNFAIYIVIAQAIYIHSPFKLHYYVFITIGIVICILSTIWLLKNMTKIYKNQTVSLIKKNLSLNKCPKCNNEISIIEVTAKNYKGEKLKTFIIVSIVLGALIGNGSGVVLFVSSLSSFSASYIMFSLFLILMPWIILYVFINVLSPFKNSKIPDPDQFKNRSCPVCGLNFVVKCDKCGNDRHNLLPYCNTCGNQKTIEDI